jgi:hypothetical protein
VKKSAYFLISCLLGILLNACAFDVVHVKQIPTKIESTNLSKTSFELEKEVNVDPGQGYRRKLKQGTKWNYVGTVSYGDVFKTKDQILTIEASHIYEAYIVVSSGKLVGFYLPVERSYSPLDDPQVLYMKEINY